MKITKNQAEAAEKLGIGERQLRNWLASGCPGRLPGGAGYDLEAIRRWRETNVLPRRGGKCRPEPAPAATSPRDAGEVASAGDRQRLLRAMADQRETQAALAALRLKIERREFMAIEEVRERDLARIYMVKHGLLGLARSAAAAVPGLDQKEAEVVLMRQVRDLLTRFSKM